MDLDAGHSTPPGCPHETSTSPAEARKQRVLRHTEVKQAFTPIIRDVVARVAEMSDTEILAITPEPRVRYTARRYPDGAAGWKRLSRREFNRNGGIIDAPYWDCIAWLASNASSALDRGGEGIAFPQFAGPDGRYTHFLWAPTRTEHHYWIGNHPLAPIGAYGRDAARRLLVADRVMLNIAGHCKPTSAAITRQHRELLYTTSRGVAGVDAGTALKTFGEGMSSLLASFSFAQAELLEGIDNPDDVVTAAVESEIPTIIAAVSPPFFVQPSIFAGTFLPGLIRARNARSLEVARQSELIEAKRQFVAAHPRFEVTTGFGCPVAADIHLLSQAFLRVYRVLNHC